MKKLLLILICVPLLFACGRQTNPTNFDKDVLIEQFNKDMRRTIEATNNKDWDIVMDITYPKLFDVASKEQLIEVFEGIFDFYKDFQLRAENITDISLIINYEGDYFTRFFYDNEIIFTFYNSDDFDNTLPVFIDQYGENNVKALRNTNSINILYKASQIAILEENSNEWKKPK